MELNYQISTNITLNHILEKIEHLTFPPVRKRIQSIPLQEPFTGVWAIEGKEIIGAVLADKKDNGVAELFSFYVKPEKRNNKIGSQLLTLLETSLLNQRVKYVQSRYWSNWNSVWVIEKLLKKNGWDEPVLIRIIAEGNIESYKKVSWPEVKFSSGFSFFSFEEITSDQKAQLDQLIENNQVPKEFNPFQHQEKMYKPASILLEHNTGIAGWNIAYRLKEDTIEYNNLYLLENYRKRGYAIKLLQESFAEQYKHKIPKVTWIVNADNQAVMKMVKQIAGDHLNKYIEVKASRKILQYFIDPKKEVLPDCKPPSFFLFSALFCSVF